MKADVKLVYMRDSLNSSIAEMETNLNDLLEVEYVMHGSPIIIGKVLLYTMLRPGTKEFIKKYDTPYPSERQTNYIRWAYAVTDEAVATAGVNRNEASELISHHKDTSEGVKLTDKNALKDQLDIIRGNTQKVPLPPKPDAEEDPDIYDDEIPF